MEQKTTKTTAIVPQKVTMETAYQADAPTVYKDDPVTGGQVVRIVNHLTVQAPPRIQLDVKDWIDGLSAAESRYFPDRSRLYDIYSAILMDGHLTGLVSKRINSVINNEIYFQDSSGKRVREMDSFIRSHQFRELVSYIMDTRFWGISGLEFIPGKTMNFRPIPRKHIDTKNQLINLDQNLKGEGYDYTKMDNVWILGQPEDIGLLNVCCPLVLYKRAAMADWANFIEIFGMPVRKITYDPYDPTAEARLKKMVEESGNLLAVMIPNTAQFEILDGKTSNANGDLQLSFIQMLDQQMSIAVLGNTETTSNSGTGSQAKSKEHGKQQREITLADIWYLGANLNNEQFLRILQSYGMDVAGGYFVIKREADVDRLAQRSIIDSTLVGAGLKISANYFYETYDIPKPEEGDELVEHPEPATAPGETPKGKTTKGKAKPEDKPDIKAIVQTEITAALKSFFG